jgi:methylated-DNA-[protein]-cysteine S-methyltransferase
MLRLLKLHYRNSGYNLIPNAIPCDIRDKLKRYFAGDVRTIDDIAVETAGTAFQRSVWKELRNIPSGSPISYRTLAEQIDRPKAVRAVGLANGCNPIGIVVPCHRVIGANGSLTGYGGGLERKRWLLDHEQRHASAR